MYNAPSSRMLRQHRQRRGSAARRALRALSPRRGRQTAADLAEWASEPQEQPLSRLVRFAALWRTAPVRLGQHVGLVVLVGLVLLGDSLFGWSHLGLRVPGSGMVQGYAPIPAQLVATAGEQAPYGIPAIATRAASAPAADLAAVVPPPQMPLPAIGVFRAIHQLGSEETLGEVALRYGLSLDALIWSNGLADGDLPTIGQDLRIPQLAGLPYVVREGDTLDSLAAQFAVSAAAVAAFAPNRLAEHVSSADQLPVGRELFLPGAEPPLPQALLDQRGGLAGLTALRGVPAGQAYESEINIRSGPSREYERVAQLTVGERVGLIGQYQGWLKVDQGGVVGWVRADLLAVVPEQVSQLPELRDFPPPPPRWVWPARGTITSGFGRRWGSFHNGLDIANRAWTPIVAARSGQVKEAGWCRGYGYCVKITHGGGLETHYGHMIDQPSVEVGEEVVAGQSIGYMGSTYDRAGGGYSTGVHLHLTILVNGVAVNPLKFLP
jgi:murein DD-endopeptidase MepM/ murein hydrolase activator NlpD